jgi:hypothetical protein
MMFLMFAEFVLTHHSLPQPSTALPRSEDWKEEASGRQFSKVPAEK